MPLPPIIGLGLSAATRFAAKRAAKKAVAKGIKRKATAQAAAKKAIKNKKESLHHSDLSPAMKRDVNFIKDHGHKAKYVIQKGKKPVLQVKAIGEKSKSLGPNPSLKRMKNWLGY